MKLKDLNARELRQAQEVEIVVVDNGDGTFDTLKDRERWENKYNIATLLDRFNDVKGTTDNRTTLVLWVKA